MPRSASPASSALALLLGAGILLAACSHDGRTLAPVDPNYTTTSGVPQEILGAPEVGSAAVSSFLLSSDGFGAGGELTPEFTCAGAGISPPLSWTEAPAGAELAIVMRERSATAEVHWIVTGIDPVVQGFGRGAVPEGAVQQVNATGTTGYLAPCPDAGTGVHSYDISIHVLDERLVVDPSEAAADLAARIETTSREHAELTGLVTA